MTDAEFAQWLLFMLFFAVFPIKPLLRFLFQGIVKHRPPDIEPCLNEERSHERHYCQLYRPGDQKYYKIVQLSNKAKSIN